MKVSPEDLAEMVRIREAGSARDFLELGVGAQQFQRFLKANFGHEGRKRSPCGRLEFPTKRGPFQLTGIGQLRRGQAALRKFKDSSIRDDIPRNVVRKLARDNRLVGSAPLIQENGGSIDALALTMSAALFYRGPDEKPLEALLAQQCVDTVFAQISGCPVDGAPTHRVVHYFHQLKPGIDILKILDS